MNKFKVQTVMSNYYKYSDVNKDPKLRKMMVEYYKKKIKKWISSSREYESKLLNKFSKNKILNSSLSEDIFNKYINDYRIYKILREFVNKRELNWYDLKKYKKNIKKKVLNFLIEKIDY